MKHRKIYEQIYADPRTYRGYGATNHGRHAYGLIEEINPFSIVDIGCGNNAFLHKLRDHHGWPEVRLCGVDFAHPLADVTASATDLPFYDQEYDLAVSFDCLEHLDPGEVDQALKEIRRVSRQFLFHIAYRDSVIRAPDGSTLHPTVQPEEWWIDQMHTAGAIEIECRDEYLIGRWGR